MERVAFIMQLKEGSLEEYKRRHDEIWPELSKLIKEAGISDYSIFLEPKTLQLFAVQKKVESPLELAKEPIMRKWWDYMADLMEVNPDNSPVCIDLIEIFHLE
ncbi:MAG: L-rhamnose mutarotase [Spirochaetales bacterium]|nr:L-rhamnose mutarotase [Spirochaetales bacterium]